MLNGVINLSTFNYKSYIRYELNFQYRTLYVRFRT
jgi:hypothetical protein